jgi:threonine/homoserine/homoserine lactone efflux protein
MDAPSFLPPPMMVTALLSFTVANNLTPGPNNLMLATSGVNFGVGRTVPHMLGINAGYVAALLLVGFGLGGLFQTFPWLRVILQVAGGLVTLWLAWKVATAGSFGAAVAPHPMNFWAAASFQAVNLKLWLIVVTAMALFVRPTHAASDVAFITVVMALVNLPVMLLWTGLGAGLGDFLKAPGRLRAFNILMGALLALTTVSLLHG